MEPMKTRTIKVVSFVLFVGGVAVTQAVPNKASFDPSFAAQQGHADRQALASTFRSGDPQLNRVRVPDSFSRLPLCFEPSPSQPDGSATFLARGNGYRLFLAPAEAVLSLKPVAAAQSSTLRMKFLGANAGARLSGLEALPGKVNYITGNDPAQWRLDVPAFAKVRYEQAYPGVDLVFYGNQRQLEYDLIVAPGADPRAIALRFEGAERIEIDEAGELVLEVGGQDLRFHKPLVYQETGRVRKEVAGRFVLRPSENGRAVVPIVGFQIAAYDTTQPLIIDPVLAYATYLGGSKRDSGWMTFDSAGSMYAFGETTSANFPQAAPALAGGEDVFVCKFNAAGNALLWTTFLGGSGNDNGMSIFFDGSGNVFVFGDTSSTNFPTQNAAQPAFGGVGTNPFGGPARDGFLAKLDASGHVLFSTYIGGSGDESMTLFQPDSAGNIYAYGQTSSHDFPTHLALQPTFGGGQWDKFIAKYNASGTRLYATYLGGSGDEWGVTQLLFDGSQNPIFVGSTSSPDFPTTVGAFQRTYGGGGTDLLDGDLFVTKLKADGSALIFSTYLGGSGDEGGNIQILDSSGNMILAGGTSSPNFPTKNPVQAALGGSTDMFVTKLKADGSGLIFSTYLGGSGGESACPTVQADSSGNLFVCGGTGSTDYPTKNAAQASFGGGSGGDLCVTKLNPAGDTILFSTYFGGSGTDGGGLRLDANGNFYLIGQTTSPNLPTLNAFQPSYGGGGSMYGMPSMFGDAFVAKFNAGSGALIWSTYYGGKDEDAVYGAMLDAAGNVYLGGNTASTNLPTANPIQAGYGGGAHDSFVAKITAAGGLEFSSYYGGNGDEQALFVRNASGDMYLFGTTTSTDLKTVGALQSTYGGGESDMFIAKITPSGGATFSILPVNQSYPTSGGSGSVQVSGSGAWSVVNNNTWIHITSGGSGSGNSTVQYTVDANAGAARTGVLTIAGQTFSVIQDGQAAGLTLSPTSQTLPAAGGVYGVSVTAPSTTAWTATPASADPWITIVTGASGTGNGTVSYRVAANPGGARTGSITIGGQTFTVNQQAATVVFTISPESETFSDAGGTGEITVFSSNSATAWTAQPSNSWIHITSGTSGTGSGTVNYSIDANTSANSRTGVIRIGDQVFTIVQAGAPAAGTADLAVAKISYPDTVNLGAGSITNTIVVVNVGPDSARGVSLIDTLPNGMNFVSATITQGTFSRSGNSVTFAIGNLAAFGSANIVIVAQPTVAGMFINTARVVATTTDPDPDNNEASAEVLVRSALPEADLVVQGYADWDPVEVNTELTYITWAWNWGPDEATGVFLTNTLPAGVTFVSADITQGPGTVTRNGNVVIANIGSLLYDEWTELTIVVRPTAVGVITDQSRGTTTAPDPDSSNNTLSIAVTVYDPSGSADSDGDGMPDDWETANGLDLTDPSDAWQDPDGDGRTNLQEYREGTNPWVPDSELVIGQITREGNDIVVRFPTQAGVQYQLERTSNIASGSWTAVGDPVNGTGDTATVTDTNAATQSQAFYRVKQM